MRLTRVVARIVSVVVCVIAVACISQLFADQNKTSSSIEDQQVAAKARIIVAQAKEIAKTPAKDSKKTLEAGETDRHAETLGEILSACPQEIRREFLESIAFVNGGVASFYVGGIQKCLAPDKMDALFKAMGRQIGPVVMGDNGKTCRCSTITWLWGCKPWLSASCEPRYCNGSCKEEPSSK